MTDNMFPSQVAIDDMEVGHFTLFSTGEMGQLWLPGVVEYIKVVCRDTYADRIW